MRWYITKKALVLLIGALVAVIFVLALTSCIPVTIRPQFDDQNKPIAIPVTPVGSISPDGTLNPIYPVSDKSPQPTNWGSIGAVAGAVLSAFLAAYGINLRGAVSKLTTGLRLTSELADAQAQAFTPEEVAANKKLAAQTQEAAGVRTLIQKVRGK
jgi:uncharacterized membrane protein (DUF441 family)